MINCPVCHEVVSGNVKVNEYTRSYVCGNCGCVFSIFVKNVKKEGS